MQRGRDRPNGHGMPRRWGLIALLLVAPCATPAQVSLGVRLGYSTALGDARGDLAMGDWVGRQVPIQADLLLRVSPRLSVGAYASYGFGLASGEAKHLCELFGCRLSIVRAGVQAVYELPTRGFAPWAGAGLGYQWSIAAFGPRAGEPVNVTFGGFEWLNVQGGADWRLGRRLGIGPFLTATLARYSSGTAVPGDAGIAASRTRAATHSWCQIGLRARVDL
jgi:hypothetical protein